MRRECRTRRRPVYDRRSAVFRGGVLHARLAAPVHGRRRGRDALVLPVSASAWEYVVSNGQPGHVWMPPAYPFEDGRFTTYGPFLMFTTFEAAYICEAPPRTGAALVTGISSSAGTAPSGTSRRARTRRCTRSAPGNRVSTCRGSGGRRAATSSTTRGQFRVRLLVAWAGDGVGLGHRVTSPSQLGDLRCRSMLRPC